MKKVVRPSSLISAESGASRYETTRDMYGLGPRGVGQSLQQALVQRVVDTCGAVDRDGKKLADRSRKGTIDQLPGDPGFTLRLCAGLDLQHVVHT